MGSDLHTHPCKVEHDVKCVSVALLICH